MNQYDEFSYQPKLRKYMSDPFGDFYYHNNHNYIHGNSYHHSNFNNQSDNIDGGLSAIYEEENPFYNHHTMMPTNFKKDEDDTLYGAYVSQNDTIEDLINSQSKGKANKQPQSSNINNNFNNCGDFYSTMEDGINNSISGNAKYQNRNTCNEQFIGNTNNIENFSRNAKQRTSSVATTDLHNSHRKLDFEYGFEGNNNSFNKIH